MLAAPSLLFLRRRHVPKPDCLIVTPRGQGFAVRAKDDAVDRAGMPFERRSALAAGYVP